jgi:hypothetical protein
MSTNSEIKKTFKHPKKSFNTHTTFNVFDLQSKTTERTLNDEPQFPKNI